MNIVTNLFWSAVAETPVNPWEGETASDSKPSAPKDSYEEAKPSSAPQPAPVRTTHVTSRVLLADTDKEEEESLYETEVLYKAANDVFVMHFDEGTATSDALQMVADALAEAELEPAKMQSYVIGYNGKAPLDKEYVESTEKGKPGANEVAKNASSEKEPVEEEETVEPGFKFKAVHGYDYYGEEEKAYPAQSIFVTARPFKGGIDQETDLWFSERLDDLVENSTQYFCEISPETPFDDMIRYINLWVEKNSLVGDNSVFTELSNEVSEDGKTLNVTIIPKDYANISDILSAIDFIGLAAESVPCSVGGTVEVSITVPDWNDDSPDLADLKDALVSAFGKKGSKVNVNFVKDENAHIRVYLGVATVEKGALQGTVYAPPRMFEAWESIDQFQGDYEELASKVLSSGKKLEDYKPVVVYERPYGSGDMPEQNAAQEFLYRIALSVKQTNTMRLYRTVQSLVTKLAETEPQLFEAQAQDVTYIQDLSDSIGRVESVNSESGGKLAEELPDLFTPERLAVIKTTDDIDGYAQTILQEAVAADPTLVEKSFPSLIAALERLDGGPAAVLERLTVAKPDLIPQTLPALIKAEAFGDDVVALLKEWIPVHPVEFSTIILDFNAIALKDKRIATMLRQVAVKNPTLLPSILPVLVLTREVGKDIAQALEKLLTSEPDAFNLVQYSVADAMKINKDIRNMAEKLKLGIVVNDEHVKRRTKQAQAAYAATVKDSGEDGSSMDYTPLKEKILPFIVHSKQVRDGAVPTEDVIPEIGHPFFTVMLVPKNLPIQDETFKTFQDVVSARDTNNGGTRARKEEADEMLYQLYLHLRQEGMWNDVVTGKLEM